MARGKATSEESKAKVVELKMKNLELSSRDIAKQLEWTEWEVSSDTVCDIINKKYRDNQEFKTFIDNSNNIEKIIKIKWTDELNIDIELFREFLEYTWWAKEAKESLEWFMLQSIWRWYIRRKAINKNTRYSILARHNFKCCACWVKPSKDNDVTLHIDHILPFSMWWLDVESNYQILCLECNTSKGNSFFIKH